MQFGEFSTYSRALVFSIEMVPFVLAFCLSLSIAVRAGFEVLTLDYEEQTLNHCDKTNTTITVEQFQTIPSFVRKLLAKQQKFIFFQNNWKFNDLTENRFSFRNEFNPEDGRRPNFSATDFLMTSVERKLIGYHSWELGLCGPCFRMLLLVKWSGRDQHLWQ